MSKVEVNIDMARVLEEVRTRLPLRGIAEEITETARDRAPVDTGNLKRSIELQDTEGGKLTIRTRCGYGAYVELGTKRMSARPFLAPAAKHVMFRVVGHTLGEVMREFKKS